MDEKAVIQQTAEMVKQKFLGEGSGHDRRHIERVRNMALHIWQSEWWDRFIIELWALLHDIADRKFHDGDDYAWGKVTRERLNSLGVEGNTIEAVVHVVDNVSYKWAGVANKMKSKEGFIVQDADRLDALGAIGIARNFSYGGAQQREMRNPEDAIVLHDTAEAYKSSSDSTIHHFYQKTLLLKDRMNTETGKKIAKSRHAYIEQYLEQFFAERKGER